MARTAQTVGLKRGAAAESSLEAETRMTMSWKGMVKKERMTGWNVGK